MAIKDIDIQHLQKKKNQKSWKCGFQCILWNIIKVFCSVISFHYSVFYGEDDILCQV